MIEFSSTIPKSDGRYLPSIDGLRAIAVLGVIVYHFEILDDWIPGGFIGIDVFFVISGFLITRIILADLNSSRWIRAFYYNRARRIFPALIFAISLTLLASMLLMTPLELKELGREIFGGGTFTSNFIYQSDFDYFDKGAAAKPLLHLWSLGIEVQFYLFWPVLIWAVRKMRISLRSVIIALTLASFIFSVYQSYYNPTSSFYSPATRGWELALGGLIATREVNISDRSGTYLRYLGGVLLIVGFTLIDSDARWPSTLSLIPVLGTAFILIGNLNPQSQSKILTYRSLIYLGRISYPLYLFHWPMYSIYRISMGSNPDRQSKVILLCLCFTLAHLFHKIVEARIRNNGNFYRIIPALIFTLVFFSIIGVAISTSSGLNFRYSQPASVAISERVFNQFEATEMQNKSCVERYGDSRTKQYAWWFCRSNSNDPPEVLLWGNSYANQYFEGLAFSSKIQNRSILSIGDCSVQRERDLNKSNPCFGEKWFEQFNFVKELIIRNNSLKFVIIAGLKEQPNSEELDDLRNVISFLRDQDRNVIIFYPHVMPVQSIFSCLDRPIIRAKWNCEVSLDVRRNLNAKFAKSLDLVSTDFSNIHVFDPNSAYCDEDSCKLIIQGNFVLRDSTSHMSDYGSRIVASTFSSWALRNVPNLIAR